MDSILPIEQLVRDLKVDRDTWQAVALQFKTAFEAQTARLEELQDICFATQAELENERAQHHRVYSITASTEGHSSSRSDGVEDSFGTATLCTPPSTNSDCSQRPFYCCANPLFNRVRNCIDQNDYGSALTHVERLLCGPLSSKARAEGLLLKSIILRALGPEEIFNALAACSEALELCNRLSELECFLTQIQRQCNTLYQELRILHQAYDTVGTADNNEHILLPGASEFCNSEDDEPDWLRCTKRRTGFDESRTTEGILAQLEEKAKDNKRRRTSSQFKQRALAKARHVSLPYHWVKARTE